MAISDANCKFLHIDVGAYGSEGDSTVFGTSTLGRKIINDELQLPEDTTIGETKIPFYFIGDDAFPLCKRLIKPYSTSWRKPLTNEQVIFNYRLSRARRCVENAFGILTAKWLCLSRTIFSQPNTVKKMVTACCLLHNHLLTKSRSTYCPPGYADYYDENGKLIEGEWRKNKIETLCPLQNIGGRLPGVAKNMRDNLMHYVNSVQGSVNWQIKSAYLD